jgi:hypothetical protein
VDLMRAEGVKPPERLVGQVAKVVGELVSEGQPPEVIARALKLLTEKRHLGPSALPSLIPEAAAGPGQRGGPEHPLDVLRRQRLRQEGLEA